MENGLNYDRKIETNFNDLNLEHQTVLNFVGQNKTVLEIGCHTGYFSYWLRNKNCRVIGLDIYQPCLEKAEKYLDRSILGNVEDDTTWAEINKEKYDVILLMHVLEHLINPDLILAKFKSCLNEGGKVIICLPNISNWNSRVNILKGKFEYTEHGLMDKTHLRFFNYFTANKMIKEVGFNVLDYKGTSKVFFNPIPNLPLIWRMNSICTNLFRLLFFRRPNLVDSVMVFKIEPM